LQHQQLEGQEVAPTAQSFLSEQLMMAPEGQLDV
jgi:hypothetical protein